MEYNQDNSQGFDQDNSQSSNQDNSQSFNQGTAQGYYQYNTQFNEHKYNKNYNRKAYVSTSRFDLFGMSLISYAVICGICLYDNWSGILTTLFTFISIGFVYFWIIKYEVFMVTYTGNALDVNKCKRRILKLMPYYVAVILLAVSLMSTSNKGFLFINNILILALFLFCVRDYFYDTSKWGIVNQFSSLFALVVAPIEYLGICFLDVKAGRQAKQQNDKNGSGRHVITYILIGIGIALPVLAIVVNMLSNADPVFEEMIDTLVGTFFESWHLIKFPAFVFCAFLFFYGLVVKYPRNDLEMVRKDQKTGEPIIAITFLGLLTLIYLMFSVIQILYLFMNSMTLPDGMTYAEYARMGCYQLVVVSILNLVIVSICTTRVRENTVLKIVLTIMTVCSIIMIISAVLRTVMYVREYGFTRTRYISFFLLAMIFAIIAGIMIKLYLNSFPVVRYSIWIVVGLYIILVFSRMDYRIADYNLNGDYGREPDYEYVMRLSYDAVPVICDYIASLDDDKYIACEIFDEYTEYISHYDLEYYFERIIENYKEYSVIRGFNISRYKANELAKEYITYVE